MRYFLSLFTTFLIFIFFFPNAIYGQEFNATSLQQILSVTISPENPQANESVTIDIRSFSLDLDQSLISWYRNGEEGLSGIGERQFNFSTGSLGTVSQIDVYIKAVDFPEFSKQFLIYPTDIDLIWDAETFTPPFYKGKSYFTHEAYVKVVAVPHLIGLNGEPLSPETLTYLWKRNGTALGQVSGRGESTLGFSGSYLGGKEEIEVLVSSPDNTLRTVGSITLTPRDPEALVYENSPLFGILYNNAIVNQFDLRDEEVSFTGVPYFFGGEDQAFNTIFNWSINDESSEVSNGGDTITLRNEEGLQGKSLIELSVENTVKKLQISNSRFFVNFGNQQQ